MGPTCFKHSKEHFKTNYEVNMVELYRQSNAHTESQ